MLKNYYIFVKTFLLHRYKLFTVITFLLTVISGGLSGLGLGLYIPVINQFLNDQDGKPDIFSRLSSQILDFLHVSPSVWTLITLASVTIILGALMTYITMLCSAYLALYAQKTLKDRLVEDLLNRRYKYFFHAETGKTVSILTEQAIRASSCIEVIFRMLTGIVLAIAYFASLLLISYKLSVLMIVFGGIVLFVHQFFVRKMKQLSQMWQAVTFKLTNLFTETMVGIKIIKAMGLEYYRKTEVEAFLESERKLVFRVNNCHHLRPFVNAVMAVIFVSAIIVIGIKIINLSSAGLIVFLMVVMRSNVTLQAVNSAWLQLAGNLPSLSVVLGNLDWERSDKEAKAKPRLHFEESITLENVSFAYEKNHNRLNDINMTISKKEFVALVGPSGGGKSTLIDLILGLHHPSLGTILYDGKPLDYYSLVDWCKSIGMVPQEIILFNDSVANNISYGDPNSDLEAVKNVAKLAHADDFISECADEYDTLLGDRGIRLSGGQKQRIALARAMYHNPAVLVLDEATSALDTDSEKMIQESLERMHGSLTIIAVAHRLSTIRNADSIYYIEDGLIKESGSHYELLKNGRYYKRLVQEQESGISTDLNQVVRN